MKVSAKGRYGLRAMLDLAGSYGGSPLLMSEIAAHQGLSRKHLHAMLTSLKAAGLVVGIRGPGGGFVLSRPPDEIRLSEVLRSLEGPVTLVDCVGDKDVCSRSTYCVAREVWVELAMAIEKTLNRVTLADLVRPRVGAKAQETEGSEGCGSRAGCRRKGAPPSAASRKQENEVGAL